MLLKTGRQIFIKSAKNKIIHLIHRLSAKKPIASKKAQPTKNPLFKPFFGNKPGHHGTHIYKKMSVITAYKFERKNIQNSQALFIKQKTAF